MRTPHLCLIAVLALTAGVPMGLALGRAYEELGLPTHKAIAEAAGIGVSVLCPGPVATGIVHRSADAAPKSGMKNMRRLR